MLLDNMHFIVAMAQPSPGQPSLLVQFLPFAMILAIFYFIILLPMRLLLILVVMTIWKDWCPAR